MATTSEKLTKLLALKNLLNEAIKSQKRSDNCHEQYVQKTNETGFNRSRTTTFNANASHNAVALKSDINALKNAFIETFKMDVEVRKNT